MIKNHFVFFVGFDHFGELPLTRTCRNERKRGMNTEAIEAVVVGFEALERRYNLFGFRFFVEGRVPDADMAIAVSGEQMRAVGSQIEIDPLIGNHIPIENAEDASQVSCVPTQDFRVLQANKTFVHEWSRHSTLPSVLHYRVDGHQGRTANELLLLSALPTYNKVHNHPLDSGISVESRNQQQWL